MHSRGTGGFAGRRHWNVFERSGQADANDPLILIGAIAVWL